MSSVGSGEQGMVNGTLAATLDAPTPRLSPKVRRLLREHGLAPDEVPGTGAGGRPTPGDVVRAAGGHPDARPAPRSGGTRPPLASPLARRLLRDAGLTLDDVPAVPANDPVTSGVVARLLDERTGGSRARSTPGTHTADVDLSRLLVAIAGATDAVRRRSGVDLPLLAPVALATCRALRRHPAIAGDVGTAELAVAVPTGDSSATAGIPGALDLTVTGLTTRLADLAGQATDDALPAGTDAFVLTDEAWVGTAAAGEARPGLVLGTPEQRPVEVTDEHGLPATATRWVTTLRLTGTNDEATAMAFLGDLRRELGRPDLLSDVA